MWLSQLNAKPLKVNILETVFRSAEAQSATQQSPKNYKTSSCLLTL